MSLSLESGALTVFDERPFVIIGGGCQGIFLADELARRGQAAIVVDQEPFAAYSSTRNQGWLQSGAYYAARGDAQAAAACRQGHEKLVFESPEHLASEVLCYFLFEEASERDHAIELIRDAQIDAANLSESDYRELSTHLPLLQGSPLKYALRTSDHPVDTSALLRRTAFRAAANGAEFLRVRCPHVVGLARTETGWRVSLGGGRSLTTSTVVVAAGAYVDDLLYHVTEQHLPGVTKVPVLTLQSPDLSLSSSMLIAPYATRGPNLVPFRSAAGRGTTVCVAGEDVDCDERGAFDEDLSTLATEIYAQSLYKWFPAIRAMSEKQTITAHFYACQKLRAPSRHRWLLELSEVERRLIAVYPGKFTSAPTVAQECADLLLAGSSPTPGALISKTAPEIAQQRYYDSPTFKVTPHHMEGIEFESINLGSPGI